MHLQAAHASGKALLKVDGIDKATLRQFDASCWVTPPLLAPDQIK
jgi:putative transcriptional regulator